MCLTQHTVASLTRWNWDGDEIIHKSIVPSSRPIVGIKRKQEYDIDIREFLVTDRNEVMKRTLHEGLKRHALSLPWSNWTLFESRQPGAFDHRADIIASYVFEHIEYLPTTGSDPWMFPDETLTLLKGDCEDRSFLLASLLLASGISSYNVRVALGQVEYGDRKFDHVWVMYKNEAGLWMLLEPLLQNTKVTVKTKTRTRRANVQYDKAEYKPQFIFNDAHLWAVKRPGHQVSFRSAMELRQSWKKFKPEFAGEVHQSVLKEALSKDPHGNPATPAVAAFANVLNSYFHSILGNTIDNIDSPRKYNPLEHFDNGLIDDSWTMVGQNLGQFGKDNKDTFTFALAAHAIADFYAHSSYTHFAPKDNNAGDPSPAVRRYSAGDFVTWKSIIKYDGSAGFDLGTKKFSINTHHWQGKLSQRAGKWAGKLLSERYAQADDSDRPSPSWLSPSEVVGYYTEGACQKDWDSLGAIAKYPDIACAPHHNEIAVDEDTPSSMHMLYPKGQAYTNQFNLRRNSAVHHVREAFFSNWNG